MRSRPGLLLLLLAASALAAAPAAAGTAVLYDGVDATEAAIAGKEALGTGDFAVLRLADLDALPPRGLAGIGATVEPCGAGVALDERIARATAQVDELDYEAALKTLAGGEPTGACGAGPASTDALYQLFFLAGLAHFFGDDVAQATVLFGRAAAIDPARAWDEAYPPTPKAAFLEGLQAVLSRPGASVQLPAGEVVVDGRPVVMGQVPALHAGVHIVDHDGARYLVGVPASADVAAVRLVPAADLRAALLEGAAWTAPWMTDVAAAQGWDQVALVGPDGVAVFRSGAWIRTPGGDAVAAGGEGAETSGGTAGGTARVRRPPDGRRVAGAVLAGAGAGLAVGGFALHAGSFGAGNNLLQFDPGNRAEYESLVRQNRAGFAMGVAGTGVAVAGFVMAVIPSRNARVAGRASALPWVSGGPAGVSLGLAGSF